MRKINSILMWVIFAAVILGGVGAARPYWNRYWLREEMKTVANYGTKNSIQNTKEFLTKKMKEEGYDFTGEDFIITKDQESNVTISITYSDEISLFGVDLKDLKFTVRAYVRNIPRML